jgi:uracil-DNA glycosylase family 4
LQTFKKQKECGARKDRFISAKLVFIREPPGNNEDEKGKPFVGAADRVLSIAVEKAGKKTQQKKTPHSNVDHLVTEYLRNESR